MALTNWIKKYNVELQFWGYEFGNVLAAISGVGGFIAFYSAFSSKSEFVENGLSPATAFIKGDLFATIWQQPDLAVTLCIGLIVLISPLIRSLIAKISHSVFLEVYDYLVVLLALTVLIFALRADTSWITVSGSAFVVASAFLRYGLRNPLFLKLGGLLLQIGGIALCLFGVILVQTSIGRLDLLLGCLTMGTGYYVFAAGVLTYIGGMYQTEAYASNEPDAAQLTGSHLKFFHPTTGLIPCAISRCLDKPYDFLCRRLINPSIFWISIETKATKPFITSMAARLPWRFATGSVALVTGTDAGLAFAFANFFWALGDVAIGSIDWDEKSVAQSPMRNHDGVLASGAAVLLLPGSIYPNGSKSVVVSHLRLNELDIRLFMKNHGGLTSVCFIDRQAAAEHEFYAKIKDHLFVSVEA